MKKKVKYIIWGIIALAVLGGVVYSLTAPTALPLTKITALTAELSFSEQGLYTAGSVMRIFPLTQGQLLEVKVKEGQTVSAGDVLCLIDAEPLRRQIEQIEGSIRAYEAQSQSASTTTQGQLQVQNILIEQNQKSLERAREDLKRAEGLYEAGAMAKVELDNYRTAVEQSEAALNSSLQAQTITSGGSAAGYYRALIEVEQLNIARLEKDIENCRVISPIDGVVTTLNAKDTNYIAAGLPVAEITTLEEGAIEVFISISDRGSINVGDTVALTLKRREGDLNFYGKVDSMETNAQVRLSALGVEERKIKVRISPDISQTGITIGDGYSVDVKFILYSEENKFTVPKTALFKDDGRDMLWLVQGGKAQAVEVVTGMELRTEFVIESGLSEGDHVVSDANNQALKDGLRVVDAN